MSRKLVLPRVLRARISCLALFLFLCGGAAARFKVRNSLFVTVGSACTFCAFRVCMCRFVAAANAYASASLHQHYREGRCRGNADAGQVPCYGESGTS